MGSFALSAIGVVRSTRTAVEDDRWDAETSRIELERIERGARHPRNNQEWPRVGIFAQRAKNRPKQPPWMTELMKGYWI